MIHQGLYKSLLALTSFKIGILLNVPKILVYPQIQCLSQVTLKIMLSFFLPPIILLRTFGHKYWTVFSQSNREFQKMFCFTNFRQ